MITLSIKHYQGMTKQAQRIKKRKGESSRYSKTTKLSSRILKAPLMKKTSLLSLSLIKYSPRRLRRAFQQVLKSRMLTSKHS